VVVGRPEAVADGAASWAADDIIWAGAVQCAAAVLSLAQSMRGEVDYPKRGPISSSANRCLCHQRPALLLCRCAARQSSSAASGLTDRAASPLALLSPALHRLSLGAAIDGDVQAAAMAYLQSALQQAPDLPHEVHNGAKHKHGGAGPIHFPISVVLFRTVLLLPPFLPPP